MVDMSTSASGTVSLQFFDRNNRLLKDFAFLCNQNMTQRIETEGADKVLITINVDIVDSSSASETSDDSTTDDEYE